MKDWRPPERLIGGTEVSALVGLNPWKGPLDVYNRLINGYDGRRNKFMDRGTREEPKIREMFVQQTGATLHQRPGIVYHPGNSFASISPDDFATIDGEDFTVDYKSASKWGAHKYGLPGTDCVPPVYSLQLHWAMSCTGKRKSALFVSFGEDKTGHIPCAVCPAPIGSFVNCWDNNREYTVDDFNLDGTTKPLCQVAGDYFEHKWQSLYFVDYDPDIEAGLLAAAERFWFEHVIPQRPPAPSQFDSKDVRQQYASEVAQ